MSDKLEEKARKRIREGWIHSVMMIEVMAVTREAARSSLEKHVQQMEKEKKTLVIKKDFKGIKEIANPFPKIEKAYSNIVLVELAAEDLDTMAYLTMNYAPTSVEILHPEKLTIDAGEAQGILASIADLIHKFSRQGMGGVVIRS